MAEQTEFSDWDLLHDSDSPHINSSDDFRDFYADSSEGIIKSDYFSLDSHVLYAKTDLSESGSLESDNPSWIDPSHETGVRMRNSGEFWSDSASDRSDSRKLSDFDAKNELGLAGNVKIQLGFDEIRDGDQNLGKILSGSSTDPFDSSKFGGFDGKNEMGLDENLKIQMGFEGIGENGKNLGKYLSDASKFSDFDGKSESGMVENANIQPGHEGIEVENLNLGTFWSDSSYDRLDSHKSPEYLEVLGEIEPENQNSGTFRAFEQEGDQGSGDNVKAQCESELSVESGCENVSIVEAAQRGDVNENGNPEEMKSGNGEEKRVVVWWKVPMEFFRFCVFRLNPVWSFSMAAAVMGFVILGRRLYKMKQKTRGLQLKVTVDDKKVSQFMSKAARLNEAFSVVRRVPIIRPALPPAGSGVSSWPVMSMR